MREYPTTLAEATFNLVFGVAPILFGLAFLKRNRPLMWTGLGFHSIWLSLQILGWWVPYLVGATPQYMEMYTRVFARTYKVLPSFPNHPAPDGMHFVMQILLLLVVVSSVGALRRRSHQGGAT